MKNFLLALIVVLLSNACTPSSLHLKDKNHLVVEQNNLETKIGGGILEKTSDFYENLTLIQSKHESRSGVLFYENVQADINFEFRFGPIETLQYIFDARGVNTVYKTSSINLVQLKIDKEKYINVLAESSSFNTLSYVYGFSNDAFKALADKLAIQDITLQHQGNVLKSSQKHLTTWSVKMLILNPLLKPDVRNGLAF